MIPSLYIRAITREGEIVEGELVLVDDTQIQIETTEGVEIVTLPLAGTQIERLATGEENTP